MSFNRFIHSIGGHSITPYYAHKMYNAILVYICFRYETVTEHIKFHSKSTSTIPSGEKE